MYRPNVSTPAYQQPITTCNKPERLGVGAFGTVIKCAISDSIKHPRLGTVAVKFPTKKLRNNNNSFSREKDIASKLKHPNIVETYADTVCTGL